MHPPRARVAAAETRIASVLCARVGCLSFLSISVCLLRRRARLPSVRPLPPATDTVHVQVNDRSGEESEHLAENQSTDNGDTQRASEFRTCAGAKHQR